MTKFHTYGRRPLHDFPNPDIVHEKLKNGEVAHVQDEDTGYVYILTNRLYNWTMIDESMIVHEIGVRKHMEKVYEVEFMEYTNTMNSTVSSGDGIDAKYLKVGKEPFLVKESELGKYVEYGKGFRIVRFVGNMEV